MSHILRSKPTVAAVYRLLPAALDELIAKSSNCDQHVRNSVKLLLAAKLAYCGGWTEDLYPIIKVGAGTNVPRPSPLAVRYESLQRRRAGAARYRTEYQRAYREAHKEKRAAYEKANREKSNARRRENTRIRRALAAGALVTTQTDAIKTVWRSL